MGGMVLLVEDDNDLAYGVQLALEREGWTVSRVASGLDGVRLCHELNPAVIVLDIGLPGMDGLQVCREIRRTSAVPILFLTARAEELDRVLGLELGGDDYMTKPFSVRELCARVRALDRRASGRMVEGEERRIEIHGLTVFPERHKIRRGQTEVHLTLTEFNLFLTLARRPGRIFTREELLSAVWAEGGQFVVDHVVNVHIRNLREKLEENPAQPALIITVRGVGYKLKEVGK